MKNLRETQKLIFCVTLTLFCLLCGVCTPQGQEQATQADDTAFEGFEKNYGGIEKTFDPLEPYNRFMYQVNDKLYVYAFEPVAQVYANIPEPGRRSIQRFFQNLSFPVNFVNNLLQGQMYEAGTESARFGINTTVGLLGFFDPAEEYMDLEAKTEDFGQTLAYYGVDHGFPLVLPFLRMSTLRGTVGKIPDSLLTPMHYVASPTKYYIKSFQMINGISLNLELIEDTKEQATDEYIFFRQRHLQSKTKRVKE